MTAAYHGSKREVSVEVPRFTAWSASRLKTYLQCPLKAKLSHIDKLPEPESEPMLEGKRIHGLAESFLNGTLDEVPKELELFGEDYTNLREHSRENPGRVLAEKQVAFREDLSLCKWLGDGAWLRVIFDAVVDNGEDVFIQDLKTGRARHEDEEQMELFAIAGFLLHPQAVSIRTELWYSKGGELKGRDYHRSALDSLVAKWRKKSAPMLADTEFLPTPGPLCKWCHYRKENGGPCRF